MAITPTTCPHCGRPFQNLKGHLARKKSPRTGSISFCAYASLTSATSPAPFPGDATKHPGLAKLWSKVHCQEGN